MKWKCIYLLSFINSLTLMSQNVIINGHVLDETKHAVPYVNVVLLKKMDSTFVNGVVTDELGAFRIETDKASSEILKFSSVGYQTLYTDVKSCDVLLSTASYYVHDVTVTGRRPVYQIRGTSFVTNVGNSLLADAGTANDVLRQLPGVSGESGTFNVFGKGKAAIYIDNRLVRDVSELERLNSKDIASVELINNPGSNYDAEVRAVLKIRLKKKEEGFASRVRFRGRQNHRFSDMEQVNLSYTTKRFNLYSLLYHYVPEGQGEQHNKNLIHTQDTLYKQTSDMNDWKQRSKYYSLETGVGYVLNLHQEMGISYIYEHSKDVYEGTDYERLTANNILEDEMKNYSFTNTYSYQHNANLYYVGKIHEKLGVNLNADYIHRDGNTDAWVSESGLRDQRTVSSLNNSIYNLYSAKLQFSYPLLKGSLDGGFDFSYMDMNQQYINVESYFPMAWFNSDEKKLAEFLNYSGQIGKIGCNVGIRYEHFHTKYYEDKAVSPIVDKTYKEFYPMASLSLPVGKVSLSLSYAKHTTRPTFYQLRNGIEYMNRYSHSKGNPYLLPTKIHDLALNAGYRHLQFTFGYTFMKDWIHLEDEVMSGDPINTVYYFRNLSKYRGLNSMLTFGHQIGFWNPSWTVAFYKSFLTLHDFNGAERLLHNPYGSFTLNNKFALPRDFILNIDCSYATNGDYMESRMKPTGSLDIGIRKSFFKRSLDVDLQCWDIFKTAKRRSTSYSQHVDFYRWIYNDSRMIRLTLTYNFRSYKNKYKGQNSAAEEMNRM